nr:putative ORF1 [Marmot picobirnavirus]
MTSNQLKYWELQEAHRSNLAREAENARSNKAKEQLTAQTNAINLQLGSGNLNENIRSHRTDEQERNRANVAKEGIAWYQNYLTQSELPIKQQQAVAALRNSSANLQNADTRVNELSEQRRNNLVLASLRDLELLEQQRSHKANEDIARFQSVANYATNKQNADTSTGELTERSRHNVQTELETKRNNLYDQALDAARLQNDINLGTARTQSQINSNILDAIKIGGNISGKTKQKY